MELSIAQIQLLQKVHDAQYGILHADDISDVMLEQLRHLAWESFYLEPTNTDCGGFYLTNEGEYFLKGWNAGFAAGLDACPPTTGVHPAFQTPDPYDV